MPYSWPHDLHSMHNLESLADLAAVLSLSRPHWAEAVTQWLQTME
jgi:hypothetical protein